MKKIISIICAVLSLLGIPVGEQKLSNVNASVEIRQYYQQEICVQARLLAVVVQNQ